MNDQKPRQIACAILARSDAKGVPLDILLTEHLPKLSGLDRALCQEMVYGVTRWRAVLDWVISEKTQGRKQSAEVVQLLRLGLYQLLYLDRVPDHAVVYEMVEMAREQGLGGQSGFVNAVLRNVAREREEILGRIKQFHTTRPAVAWSHPGWLIKRWTERWGEKSCRALLEWNNRPAETYARVNTLKADAGRVLDRWRMVEKVEYDFVRGDWLGESEVFRLKSAGWVNALRSFREGWFYVQDPSTLLAVTLLDPQAGERILDLCAAPGGKATAIAQRVDNQSLVIARDTVSKRLQLVRENCEKLGATCVETELLRPDQRRTDPGWRFDRVLVDAPCSNTGVMRRRVELRWRLKAEELPRLVRAQLDLMGQADGQLQKGGVLVYSTCSLEPEENQQVVKKFLASHAAYELEKERDLLPFRDGVDGAYVAVLRKG